MALPIRQQVSDNAECLQEYMQRAQEEAKTMTPEDQINNFRALSKAATQLTELQQKVQATFLGLPGAIPNITEEKLAEISEKLCSSATILESMQTDYETATELLALAEEVEEALRRSDARSENNSVIENKRSRIIEILIYSSINEGNKKEAEALLNKLDSPHSAQRPPSPPHAQALPDPDTNLMQVQDEGFKVNEFEQKCLALEGFKEVAENNALAIKMNDPLAKNFESFLKLYVVIKEFQTSKPQFMEEGNRKKIEGLLHNLSTIIKSCIENQKNREEAEAKTIAALKNLKEALKTALSENDETSIQGIFSQLDVEIKEKVFDSLNATLLAGGKISRAQPKTLLGQNFCVWWKGYQERLDAVDQVLLNIIEQRKLSQELQRFKHELGIIANEKLEKEQFSQQMQAVQDAFSKLSQDEKRRFLNSLTNILNKKLKNPIQYTRITSPLQEWPGSYKDKNSALEDMVSPSTAMALRFEEACRSGAKPQQTTPAKSVPQKVLMQPPSVPQATPTKSDRTQQQQLSQELQVFKQELGIIADEKFDGDLFKQIQAVQAAFSKLSKEEKRGLFNSLSQVLIDNKKFTKPIQNGLFSQPIQHWPGSYKEKKLALEYMLDPSKAKAQQTTPPKSVTQNVSSAQPAPAQVAPTIAVVQTQTTTQHIELQGIEMLKGILPLLGDDSSIADLQEAIGELMIFESLGAQARFQISSNEPRSIACRPYFHLYFIHLNEFPDLVQKDQEYGAKAFCGHYFAENANRRRAILRTIAELGLEGFENAARTGLLDESILKGYLSYITDLKPDRKDLPSDVRMLLLIGEIRSLLDPQITSEKKIQVIQNVRQALKLAWKIQ